MTIIQGLLLFGAAMMAGMINSVAGGGTLAALGIMGLRDIHQMNGLKNIFASVINGVAAVYFVFAGMIDWPSAALMAAGAIIGGYGAAGIARKIGQKAVRRIVVVIGFAMAISLMFKR